MSIRITSGTRFVDVLRSQPRPGYAWTATENCRIGIEKRPFFIGIGRPSRYWPIFVLRLAVPRRIRIAASRWRLLLFRHARRSSARYLDLRLDRISLQRPKEKTTLIDFSLVFCSQRLDFLLKFIPWHVTKHVCPEMAKILFP